MIRIEKMTRENANEVAAIESDCFAEEKWSLQLFLDELQDSQKHYYVAVSDNGVIGFCGYAQILDEGHIMNIAVSDGYRRQGIGELLMRTIIEEGKEAGIGSFTLEVRDGNVVAKRLYERMGFQCVGVRKKYYGGIEDACIYWLYL